MDTIEVIGLGAMNVDQVYRVERILTDGETSLRGKASLPGGSAANTIYGLAKLGAKTGFVGAIGDDREGKALVKAFQEAGVDTSQIRTKKKAQTGSALCLADKRGRRALYVSPGANDLLNEQDVTLEYLNRAKIIHISSFARQEQLNLLKGLLSGISPLTKVSFAPGTLYASSGLETLAPLLKKTYVLFLNRSEIKQLTGEDFKEGTQRCLELGCRLAVVTLGRGIPAKLGESEPQVRFPKEKKGQRTVLTCYVSDGGHRFMLEVSSPRGQIKDTLGAGDAFAAGFLYGILHQKSLEECAFLGEVVSRFSLTKEGARAGLPSLGQLSQRYEEMVGRPL